MLRQHLVMNCRYDPFSLQSKCPCLIQSSSLYLIGSFNEWKESIDSQISILSSVLFRSSKPRSPHMVHQSQSIAAYAPVVDLEFEHDKVGEYTQHSVNRAHWRKILRLSLALCATALCAVLGFGGGILVKQKINSNILISPVCTNPVIRREWRGLSNAEKSDYIAAVQCLRSSPSRLGLNQTLYDDFPYVHSRNGEACESKLPYRSCCHSRVLSTRHCGLSPLA